MSEQQTRRHTKAVAAPGTEKETKPGAHTGATPAVLPAVKGRSVVKHHHKSSMPPKARTVDFNPVAKRS